AARAEGADPAASDTAAVAIPAHPGAGEPESGVQQLRPLARRAQANVRARADAAGAAGRAGTWPAGHRGALAAAAPGLSASWEWSGAADARGARAAGRRLRRAAA